MKVVIDRIEGDIAVCQLENGNMLDVPSAFFENAKEGNIYNISAESAEQNKKEENAKKRLNALFGKE